MDQDEPRILCVDDEPQVVEGLKLHLRKGFQVTGATSAAEALEILRDQERPFEAILSDMQMPGMNGAAFLAEARHISPDSSRILLTGHSDMELAIAAINKGRIFRFLTKPCPPDLLSATVQAAVDHYRLIVAERDVLRNTLRGSVRVLTEILGLVSPSAFSRATRIQEVVQHVCRKLSVQDEWKYEIAAMLSQIGCATIDQELVEKVAGGGQLDDAERQAFQAHAATGSRLIAGIPRLEEVARMVGDQFQGPPGGLPDDARCWDPVVLGSQLLRLAQTFERCVSRAGSLKGGLKALRERSADFPPLLVAALDDAPMTFGDMVPAALPLDRIRVGMVTREEIRTTTGILLAGTGFQINFPLLQRLRNFADSVGILEPIHVMTFRHALGSLGSDRTVPSPR